VTSLTCQAVIDICWNKWH